MYLEKIQLQGFKTFAQKTTIEVPKPQSLKGETRGITAIVGPNGSGKSNIVDAIRWVLGEQSLKILRLKKAEDVIFSGSVKKARLGMAQVSMFLNNESKTVDVPFSEIEITRRLYRDGESEYLVNNKKVRLLDIIMLLAKANFGQKSYSIIGQGMIDYIINVSATERKDFFDEATGVKQYQIKRDQAVNKLKRTRENLDSTKSVLQELSPRLNSLTRQVKKLEKRKQVEKQLQEIQIKYYQKTYNQLLENYNNINEKFLQKQEIKINLENQVLNLQKQLDKFATETSQTEQYNNLQKQYNNLQREKNKYAKELIVLKGKKEIEYSKLGKQSIAWLENKKEEIGGKIKESNLQINELKEKISQNQDLLEIKKQKQIKVIETFEQLEDKLAKTEILVAQKMSMSQNDIKDSLKNVFELQQSFIDKIYKIDNLDQVKQLRSDAENIFDRLKSFYSRLNLTTDKQKQEQIEDIKAQIKDLLLNKDNLVNEISDLKTAIEVADAHKKNFSKDLEELDEEFTKLESELEKSRIKPSDKNKMLQILDKEKAQISEKIKFFDKQILDVKQQIDEFNESQEKKKEQIFKLQQQQQQVQSELNNISNQVNELNVEKARLETKKENIENEIIEELNDLTLVRKKQVIDEFDEQQAYDQIRKLKNNLEIIGGIDPEVVEEYKEVSERHEFLNTQVIDLEKAIKDLDKIIEELDKMIKTQFKSSFGKINKLFNQYFSKLFLGGKAKLDLIQKELEEDKKSVLVTDQGTSLEIAEAEEPEQKKQPTKTGVDIIASPPHKKVKNIAALSGGERTMTAIALICAIISNNPSPFVLLDEVDAALDEANSLRFSGILNDLSRKTQFVVITHNRVIMETADVIYGVSMSDEGVSKMLSINFDQVKKFDK